MAGLLDFMQSPEGIGLLSMVAGGMTGAQRGTPVNNIGRGLASGLMGYSGAQELARNEKKNALEEQFKALQMGQMQRQADTQMKQDAWRAGLPAAIYGTQPQVSQFQPDDPFNQGAAAFGEGVGGQQVGSGMANVRPGNPNAIQDYMISPNNPYFDKYVDSTLMPKAPSWEIGERFNAETGRKEKVIYDKNNPNDIRQFGGTEAEKIVTDNLGGKTIYRGEYSVSPIGSAQHTASPEAFLADARARSEGALNRGVTIRGQDLTNQRAMEVNTNKPLTEVQAKSAGFANRARDANAIIENIGNAGRVQPGLIKRSLETIPLVGEGLGTMANITQSTDQQQIEQAQNDFVSANLRLESGAVIGTEEMQKERKKYFPQPGDSDRVIQQKAQSRANAIKSLEVGAGPAMEKINANQPANLKIGAVRQGYVYLGGDPAQKTNWRRK